ncbi:hypothetical protein DN757_21490 [Paenibacillus silvae]|uniref:Uncharacterized protein n=1 Tax=Paenibacillus silvae TaxID=1325358 RepID=A0A2W6NF01_9BACL|nr:hypothetical protein DN757_21490 [Paenibacillus silvae]
MLQVKALVLCGRKLLMQASGRHDVDFGPRAHVQPPRIGRLDLDIRPVTAEKNAYVMAYLEIQRRPIK